MRLIDADALNDAMYHEAFENDESYNEKNPMAKWDSGLWIRYKMFENAIDEAPTIEPKRGEWKHLKGDEWLCSNCGYVVWTEGSWEHPLERRKDYCEHCGAMMFVKGINVLNKEGADDEID